MIVFAVALLVTVGFFNMIDGIAAIANSHVFIANAHYVVGDLRLWGWIALILGVLDHRRGHRSPMGTVRVRQPREPGGGSVVPNRRSGPR